MAQDWSIGATVTVGFSTFRVVGKEYRRQPVEAVYDGRVEAVYDGRPDVYTLESIDGRTQYEFTPSHGLRSLRFHTRIS